MGEDDRKAKRYRERAEGIRSIAASLPAENTQRLLLSIAIEYERIATLLEAGDSSIDRLSAVVALKKPDNSD